MKIDRSVNATAVRDAHARRVLVNTINLIHECGARVIVEGIETRDEALLALEAGTDFVQRYYFARPGKAAVPEGLCSAMFCSLHADHLARQAWRVERGDGSGLRRSRRPWCWLLTICAMAQGSGRPQTLPGFAHGASRVFGQRRYGHASDSGTRAVVIDLIDSRSHGTGQWTADSTGAPLTGLRSVLVASRLAALPGCICSLRRFHAGTRRPVTLSCALNLEGRMVVLLIGEIVDRRSG